MMELVLGLLAMTVMVFGWRLLMRPPSGIRARVPRRAGVAVLRPPRGRNLMWAGLALGPTAILLALLYHTERFTEADQLGLALAGSLVAAGAGLTLACIAAEFRQKLSVDADHLESIFALTTQKVRWREVERIGWNPGSRWFFMVAAGACLWVPVDFDGIGDFAELALSALPPAVLAASQEARYELEALAHLGRPAAAALGG